MGSVFKPKAVRPRAENIVSPFGAPVATATGGALSTGIAAGPTGPLINTPERQQATAGLFGLPTSNTLSPFEQQAQGFFGGLVGGTPGPSEAGLAASDALQARLNTQFGRQNEALANTLAAQGILHSGQGVELQSRLGQEQGETLASSLAPYLFGSAESAAGRQFAAAQQAPTFGAQDFSRSLETIMAQLQASGLNFNDFLKLLSQASPFIGATNQQLAQPQLGPSTFSQIIDPLAGAAGTYYAQR